MTNSETAAATPPRRGCKIFEEPQLTGKWTLLTLFGKLALLYMYNSEWDGFGGSNFAIEMLGRPFLSLFIYWTYSKLWTLGFVENRR